MKNQFFFKYQQPVEAPMINGKEQPPVFKELMQSFNLDKVLTSIETPTGRTIIMDHVHERSETVPVYNKKREKIGEKQVKGLFQTEFSINHEESAKYMKVTRNNAD